MKCLFYPSGMRFQLAHQQNSQHRRINGVQLGNTLGTQVVFAPGLETDSNRSEPGRIGMKFIAIDRNTKPMAPIEIQKQRKP